MSTHLDPKDLQKLEELCVQDEPPFCQAACPLHVDVRTMTSAVAKGDFAKAAKTYQKRIPLPRILARICEQPCRPHCKRGEAGGAINIGLLERACADQAGFATAQASPRPKRPHRVAVVGAGISGLTAAVELARKDYPVTLFEAESVLGGRLKILAARDPPDRGS